jgi:hypothetical protein
LSCAGPTFRIVDEVHITPLHCGVDQPLLFRSAEVTNRSVEMGTQLAFEVDEVTVGFARNVVVRGMARRLQEPGLACRADLVDRVSAEVQRGGDHPEAVTSRRLRLAAPDTGGAARLVEFGRHAKVRRPRDRVATGRSDG